jgi:hypothetical protein
MPVTNLLLMITTGAAVALYVEAAILRANLRDYRAENAMLRQSLRTVRVPYAGKVS